MEPERRRLEEVRLENGLTLSFYDCSRPVAGDRCQVELLVSIPIAVRADYFADCPEPHKVCAAFTAAHGGLLEFRQKRIRNFIAREDVPAVLQQLKEEFLQTSRVYLLKEDFTAKYIRKKYWEWEHEERLKSFIEAAARSSAE